MAARSIGVSWLAAAVSVAVLASPGRAEPVAEFYKGKTLNLVISSAPGGGYDAVSRAIARYLGKHLPGNPVVVVRNMPGAGGIVAANHLYNAAAQDGTVIGGVQNNVPFEPLYGTKEAQYDSTKFHWLGSPSTEVSILTVWHTTPVSSIQDAIAKGYEFKLGSSGANSTPSFYGRLAIETLGVKIKLVVGYPGQNDALVAMERGEIDGYPSAFYNSLMATRPSWIKENKVKLLVQFGAEKEPDLPNVPFAPDLAKTPEDKLLIEEASAPLAIGRPFLAPPNVPPDRLAALRDAMWATYKDPEFVAEGEKAKLGTDTPRTGAQIQQIIARSYRSPPQVIDRLRGLMAQK
jgi:tripartite-type tricarboxylate transporter receptor subunit TctC